METVIPRVCVGVDISKEKFDACVLSEHGKPSKQEFRNTPDGFATFMRWVVKVSPGADYHFCMEATGSYHEAFATFLADANQTVSVVNPHRTYHAAKADGAGNKTDRGDAFVIAEYCRKENPPAWRRAAPEVRALSLLMRRLQSLKDQLSQERNRLQDPGIAGQTTAFDSMKRSIDFLENEIELLFRLIEKHVNCHPNLKRDRDLLVNVPGIEKLTAAWILAELPDLRLTESAKSAAAYAGLAPTRCQSGKSVNRLTHLSKRGNVHLRRALYMPAMTAMRFNPAVRPICERLQAKNRPRMVIVGAAMRKLLMVAYGVLRTQKEFEYPVRQS
jgi:transposase